MHTGYWWGVLREGDRLEDPGIGRRIILKWIFEKWDEWHGLVRSGSGYGQVAGCCECGNELSGSINCGKFPDQLRTC